MARVTAFCAFLILAAVGLGIWLVLNGAEARETAARAAAITGGNPEAGRRLIAARGCGYCHIIPRVARADGLVGPSLERFASRVYIAGVLPNTAPNLLRWLRNPPAVDPMTAMPDVGLRGEETLHVAAYLYTLR